MKVLPIPISRPQQAFRASSAWMRSLCGGRGSGKSKIGSIDISQRARPGEPWMAISPDNNMIRETTLPTFLETVNFTKQYISHVVSPTARVKFRTRWGGCAELVFKGAEVPDKLRGPNKAGLWFDEASIISKEAFDIAIACCRYQGKMGPVLATFTPRGFAHWTFESFYDGVDEALIGTDGYSADGLEWFKGKPFRARPDTFMVRCSTRDNPFAPPEYYSRISQNYSAVLALQELEGDFVEFSGMIFRREWFSKTVESAPAESTRVRYWDKAASGPNEGCFTVGLLMARDARGIYYVEDVVRGQWTPHERNQIMLQVARSDAYKYGHSVLTYIEQEGGGDGKTVSDQLITMMSEFPVYRDIVSGGSRYKVVGNVRLPGDAKIRRAQPFAAQCEAGNIRLVLGSSNGRWHRDYIEEMAMFGEYKYMDSVDASSGAYNVLQRVAPTYSNQTATRSTEVAAKSRYGHTVQHSEGDSISRWSDLPWNQDNFEGQTGY